MDRGVPVTSLLRVPLWTDTHFAERARIDTFAARPEDRAALVRLVKAGFPAKGVDALRAEQPQAERDVRLQGLLRDWLAGELVD